MDKNQLKTICFLILSSIPIMGLGDTHVPTENRELTEPPQKTCERLTLNKNQIKFMINKYIQDQPSDSEDAKNEITFKPLQKNKALFSLKIKERCETYKSDAETCCSNPNKCVGWLRDLTEESLPAGVQIAGLINQARINNKDMSPQAFTEKMCSAQNTTGLTVYGASLISQFTKSMRDTCSKKIQKCKDHCDKDLNEFKHDFEQSFSRYVPTGRNSLSQITTFAKDCAGLDDINKQVDIHEKDFHTAIEEDLKKRVDMKNKHCLFKKDGIEFQDSKICKLIPKEVLSYILIFTKAYANSSYNKKAKLSELSGEKEFINCGYQPDRVLTERPGATQAIPAPMISTCQGFVQQHLEENPTLSPTSSPKSSSGNLIVNKTLTDPQDGFQGGIIENCDKEPLPEECLLDDIPSSSSPVPHGPGAGWAGNSPSGAGGGSGGGAGGGSGGGGAGGPGAGEAATAYGNSLFQPSGSGSFAGAKAYKNSASSSNDQNSRGRFLRSRKKPPIKTRKVKPSKSKPQDKNLGTIFTSASQRIQFFCSNYDCS